MPKRNDIKKIMIIGSGPIVIGQACEFDYSGTQACKALRKLGYEIILVNSNPATIMTDPGTADVTYIEPLNVQSMIEIIENEKPDAILPNLGGQTGLNLTAELAKLGILEKIRGKGYRGAGRRHRTRRGSDRFQGNHDTPGNRHAEKRTCLYRGGSGENRLKTRLSGGCSPGLYHGWHGGRSGL